MQMRESVPLVCPFCDELADIKLHSKRIVLPHKIYTLRECTMGHVFYSVEEIPEDQSAIVDELKEIKNDAKQWRRKLKAGEA